MENIHGQQFGETLTLVLNSVNKLNKQELDILFFYVKKQKYTNHPTVLSKTESDLLQAINAGLPKDLKERHKVLREKRFNETLTKEELTELLALIEQIEKFDVERMKKLIALAKIRNVTLAELSEQLGLKPQIYAD